MALGRSLPSTHPSRDPSHCPTHGAARRRRGRLAAAVALAVGLGLAPSAPAVAAGEGPGDPGEPPGPVATVLVLDAGRAHAGSEARLRARLTAEDGTPVPAAAVTLERRVDGDWSQSATLTTDAEGAVDALAVLRREAEDNVFRARYDGDGVTWAPSRTEPVEARLRKRAATVRISGPRRVVDERKVRLRVRARTGAGQPVAGRVVVQRRPAGGTWRKARTVRTGSKGLARPTFRPRVDTAYRARLLPQDWVRGDRSPVHRVDNRPPGTPVRLPAGAPAPRVKLPRQARAVGDGANPRITAIPEGVWRSMVGRSWHSGCPVGRSGLRYLRINYWGYDGYRYRGELVAAASGIGQMADALAEMYRRKFPIRSMYRVDRFGWSRVLQGADDYRSMAAGNTSAFNCRHVVGRPGVRSPHSYGRSLDVNPWENPYRASHGWTPNGWWVGRSHDRVAWRSGAHPVVALMSRHGLRWTYGTSDAHHFDATGRSGRVIVPRGCLGEETCK